MAGKSSARRGFWLSIVDTPMRSAWEGIAFERVCMWHQEGIKLTFVTTYGVKRNENAWMVQSEVTLDDLFKE